MCKVLKIARSTFYYESQIGEVIDETTQAIVAIFKESKSNYGTRKIKEELRKLDFTISRRKIGRIMKEQGLVSTYTVAQFKVHKDTCNESLVSNELNRKFDNQAPLAVVVSDLTYGYLTKPFQNAVCEGIKKALLQGFWGLEITDIKVCLIGAYYDSVKSTPADFRDLAPLVLMEAILKAGTEIVEPMMNYCLIVPQDISGKAMADLRQMRAIISASYIKENEMVLRGKIPVETLKSYSVLLASYTGGQGIFSLDFSGYELYTGKIVLKHKIGYDSINRVRYLLQKSNTLKI